MPTFPRTVFAAACLIVSLAASAAHADPPPMDAYGDPLPPGAVARLGSARLRHAANVLTWAPDGKTFASAGNDGSVRVWDAESGREVGRFNTSTNLWIFSLVYLPGGKSLAAASQDGTLHVWDLANGREVRTLPSTPMNGSFQAAGRLAPGPEDGTVAALGGDNVCRVLDLATGKVLRQIDTLHGANGPGTSAPAFGQTALSPDGRRFAGWSNVPAADVVTVWDVADGKELFHAISSLKQVSGLAFSPDGKTLAAYTTAQTPTVVTWDVNTGKELRRYEGIFIMGTPAFSSNGKYLVAKGGDGFIHVWGLASGKDLRQLDASLAGGSLPAGGGLALSPDGKKLAVGSGTAVRVWDLESGEELHPFIGHAAAVDEMRFTPDGRRLLSCGKDGSARLWDAATGKPVATWTPTQPPFGLAPAPDGAFVVASTNGGLVRVDFSGGRPAEKVVVPGASSGLAPNLHLSPNGKMLAAVGGNRVRFWDLATGKDTSWSLDAPVGYALLAFAPDGRTLAAAAPNTAVSLWDVASGSQLRTLDTGTPAVQPGRFIPNPLQGVSHMAFSPDGRTLLCIASSELSLWEVATGRDRMRIARPAGGLTCAAFSPDGGLIAAGTASGTVLLLDAENGYALGERSEARGASVTSLIFAPDGKTLAAGSADGAIVIWDVKEFAGRPRPPAADLKPEKLSVLWQELIDGDAGRAYSAIRTLASAPAASAPFLKGRLAGAGGGGDDKRIAGLIRDLNDDDFDVREKAEKELDQLGDLAVPALRKALDADPSAETHRRAQEVLDRHKGPAADMEDVRSRRALEALERGDSPEALEALRSLVKDAPSALVKQEAEAALDRLARRKEGP